MVRRAKPSWLLTVLAALMLAGCTVTVSVDLSKLPTQTPTATATATQGVTSTPTPTDAATATAVPATATPEPPAATATPTIEVIPPTNTQIPPTIPATMPPTATPEPPAATATPVANVPLLLDATADDPRLDANNRAIVWAGDISPDGGYTQLRLVGRADGVSLYAQVMTPRPGGTITVTIGNRTLPATYGARDGWTYVGTGVGSRGWSATAFLPWGQFGGAPQPGDVWPLALTALDGDTWQGVIRWGAPPYAGAAGTYTVTVPVAQDATLGGSTDCGAYDWPDYFPTWGSRSYEGDPKYGTFSNIQAQWDTTDWPCYSQYIAQWVLPQLPAGAEVTGAWLDVYYFGAAYPTEGRDVPEYVPGQRTQAYQVGTAWDAATVTWDTAPAATENVSYTSLDWCATGVDCHGWRALDVTPIVQRAYQAGQGDAAALLYTAAGQYHSGRYIYTSEGAAPPAVRISYTLPGEPQPTWTPVPVTPTTTPTPTATSVPPTATYTPPATSTTTPTPRLTATPEPTIPIQPAVTATPQPSTGRVWYLGLGGNDANAGTASAPLRTFARAWAVMRAGDTLLIQDGTYTEPIQPLVYGREGAPVTIKAINDGKVIIDGRGQTIPLKLGDTWPGDNRSWFVVEGIVARNGTEAAVRIRGDHIILRRVSAYDAGLRSNSAVVLVGWSSDVLLEDVIAAGTGRKSILIFTSERVTVRRAFTQWRAWDGQTPDTCAMGWPAGNGINPYNSKFVTVENALVTGPMADAALRITINHESVYSPGMQVLGSIAAGAGMDAPGKPHAYPLVDDPACYVPPGGPPYTAPAWGLGVYGQGDVPGVVFRDVLAVGNAGWGFASLKPSGVGVTGGVLDHATLCANNTQPGETWEKDVQGTYGGFFVTNSQIPGFRAGEGARLANRYVDGVLTDAPLLPWPMQDRAANELGVDVTGMWTRYAGACN